MNTFNIYRRRPGNVRVYRWAKTE